MKQVWIFLLLVIVTGLCSDSTITESEYGFDITHQESTDEFTESEKNHSPSSCMWVDPPVNGVNFRPCALGACKGVRGIFSKNSTRRITRCNPGYVLVLGSDRDACHDGEWTSRGHECVQCGKSPRKFDVLESAALIIAGYNSSRGDFPWMAAIFTPLDKGLWTQICGGTLISPNIVLTAAHCLNIIGRSLKPEEIKVGLGRLSVDYYKHEPGAVVSSVKEFLMQEQFVGLNRLFDLDISLLVLEERVPINNLIMPACIDWRGHMSPKHDDYGVLAGWGLTDVDGFRSETLKWTYQRFIGYQECLQIMTAADHKFLSPDKFCTDEVKGGRAENGDSGGGLTFERGGVHYVYGIVSTKMLMNAKQLRLFTNVMNEGHRAWLGQEWRRLQAQPLRELDGKGECSKDSHCSSSKRCVGRTCLDLCPDACGFNSVCRMANHLPVCTCSPGHTGNPYDLCTEVSSHPDTVVRELGDVCKQRELDLWICKPENDCPRAAEALREGRTPQPCSKPGLVCCEPDVNKPSTVLHHKTMCRWYSQFVQTQEYDDHAQVYYVRDACATAPQNIEGGKRYDIKRGDFPHLGIIGDKDFTLLRYGSLVNEFYFLTSYISVDSLAVRVRLGIFGSPPGDGRGQPEFQVRQKHTYPEFKGDQLHNLMLCRLDSAVKFTPYIRPACLVYEHQFPGTRVIVSGKLRNSLTAMTSIVLPRYKCLSPKALYDDSVICVESNKTHEDLDIVPGFPLMVPLKEPYCSYGLLGVSSFGFLKSGRVEGYMRLSFYVPWIESVLWPPKRPVIHGPP